MASLARSMNSDRGGGGGVPSSPGSPMFTTGSTAMSTEDIIVLEQHFLSFTEANEGGIGTVDVLHDVLWHRCGEKSILRQEIEGALGTWNPLNGMPMSLKQFVATVTDIKAVKAAAGPRNLSLQEAAALFFLLSGQTDFIPTRVALALCAVLECDSFQDNYLDYIGRDGFISTLETDHLLSRRLAVKKAEILQGGLNYINGCNLEDGAPPLEEEDLGVNFLSAVADESEMLESWYRIDEDNIEIVLKEAHAMVKKEEEAQLARQKQLQGKGRRALLSYFAPEEVIPTSGSTTASVKVKSVVVAAPRAGDALQHFSEETTAQSLVARINDLKRLRRQKKRSSRNNEEEALLVEDDDEEEDENEVLEFHGGPLRFSHDRDDGGYNSAGGETSSQLLGTSGGGVGGRSSTTAPGRQDSSSISSQSPTGATRQVSLPGDPERRLFATHNSEKGKQPLQKSKSDTSPSSEVEGGTSGLHLLGSVGVGATTRLFPHTQTPKESIRANLKKRIGLSWVPTADSPMVVMDRRNRGKAQGKSPGANTASSLNGTFSTTTVDQAFNSDFYTPPSTNRTAATPTMLSPLLGGADPYSLGVSRQPFTQWREYREFVPKSRKPKKKNTGSGSISLFFSPADHALIDYNNYSMEMPRYKPPVVKPRASASGLRLDNLSHTLETTRRNTQTKARMKERILKEKVLEETGDILGMTNTEHEASLLLLEARAKLTQSLRKR